MSVTMDTNYMEVDLVFANLWVIANLPLLLRLIDFQNRVLVSEESQEEKFE